jgi:putative DNA primase/helicase
MLISNELPRLADQSGALPSRLIILRLTKSFLGCEDRSLFGRLVKELPEILLWAVEGWSQLRNRGHFIQPKSGRELVRLIGDLSSPIRAFIRDRCQTGSHCEVQRDLLYLDWQHWCSQNGRPVTNAHVFGRDLHAAVPKLRCIQHWTETETTDKEGNPIKGHVRVRYYQGITLKPSL